MVPKFNRKTEIEITYDPYRMETTIKKNGRDIKDDGNFKKCKKFIDEKIPLQTWLKEIPTRQWNGFVNEFIDPKPRRPDRRCPASGRRRTTPIPQRSGGLPRPAW